MRLLQVLIMCAVFFVVLNDAAATKLSGNVDAKDRTFLRSLETRDNTQDGEERRFSASSMLSKLKLKNMKKLVPGSKRAALKRAAAAAELEKEKKAVAKLMQNDDLLYDYFGLMYSQKKSLQDVRDAFTAVGRTEKEVKEVAEKFHRYVEMVALPTRCCHSGRSSWWLDA
ncbi:hypothetical protein PR002_g6937 [Phytophthora rubi]|uniref:RxLR effector protein n=1 Tax=Phytophthora rubi TaxID=129364 RepID=A0A6A3N520_9STRA|nr:hypothetical protein PR002_g6937 [Phytophthora rubi]